MIRNISIRPVLNGFVCEVGCQTVVFDSKAKLVAAIASYVENPLTFEREFIAQACNGQEKMLDGPLRTQEQELRHVYTDTCNQAMPQAVNLGAGCATGR